MKSSEKMVVIARRMPQYENKRWVSVRFHKTEWVPSFEDLFRLIQAICYCEDEKYPFGKGRGMVREFLVDCCQRDATWEQLRDQYEIPERA